jgi:hypothetical protein
MGRDRTYDPASEAWRAASKRGCTRSDERHHVCIEHWVSAALCAERFSVEEYASPTACVIDSQSVKSAEKRGRKLTRTAMMRGKKIKGKKRHLLVDMGVNMQHSWWADEDFLRRRNKIQLQKIINEAGFSSQFASVADYKKGELVKKLAKLFAKSFSENGYSQWVPEPVQFPAINPDKTQTETDLEEESDDGSDEDFEDDESLEDDE